jgi:hypothetical protein
VPEIFTGPSSGIKKLLGSGISGFVDPVFGRGNNRLMMAKIKKT